MFQSSRTASGNWRWQAPSACSPSSASTIWNSSPSRIRRATLRMTLESSTTKHIFITPSLPSPVTRGPTPHGICLGVASCGDRLALHFKHPVDVEHHQQLAIEPHHAGRDARKARVEIGGLQLAVLVRDLHDLADRI